MGAVLPLPLPAAFLQPELRALPGPGLGIAGGLVPAARWGEGEDVARIVAGLASGAFGFSTGSVINCDGGLSIQRL